MRTSKSDEFVARVAPVTLVHEPPRSGLCIPMMSELFVRHSRASRAYQRRSLLAA
jgi:hypothetical protein